MLTRQSDPSIVELADRHWRPRRRAELGDQASFCLRAGAGARL